MALPPNDGAGTPAPSIATRVRLRIHRRLFNEARRHAGRRLPPGRRARRQRDIRSAPSPVHVRPGGSIDAARRRYDMQQRKGERAVGARIELQMDVGCRRRLVANRIDDDLGRRRSASQYWCTCGADADGLAPQIITHCAPSSVRGSKPRVDFPYMSWSATCPALLQTVSGSTSVAPIRLKNRKGKLPAISEHVPV